MNQQIEVVLSEPQEAVLSSRKGNILELAGKGSGKSETIGISSGTFVSEIPEAIGFIGANTEMQLSQSTLDRVFKSWKKVYDFYEYDRFHKGGAYVVDKKPPPHFTQFRKLRTYHGTISFYNGGLIFIGSLENYMAHDGKEFAWAHLDDTKDTREEALKEVIQGRLRQYGLWYDAEGTIIYNEKLGQDEAQSRGLTAWNPLYIHTAPALMGIDWLNEMFKLSSFQKEIKKAVLREEKDFFHKEFENKAIIIYSAHHNLHNLPPNYIENQKINLVTEDAILKHVYGYPFTKTGGEYFPTFRRDTHVKVVKFDHLNPVVNLTWDFNVDPYMTCLAAQISYETRYIDQTKKKYVEPGIGLKAMEVLVIRFYREYCFESPRNSSEAISNQFSDEHDSSTVSVNIYGDADGRARIRGLGTVTNYSLIEGYLTPFLHNSSMNVQSQNIGILTRRDFINKLFNGNIPEIEIEIDENCVELIADFENVKLGPKGKLSPKNKTGATIHNHASDSFEYLVCEVCKQYID